MQICSLLRGGIGERGGVRVGHRIIEINGHSMVAMPHERIVHLLATSVGEVRNNHTDSRSDDNCFNKWLSYGRETVRLWCAVDTPEKFIVQLLAVVIRRASPAENMTC